LTSGVVKVDRARSRFMHRVPRDLSFTMALPSNTPRSKYPR
jgi:hypothetical protein